MFNSGFIVLDNIPDLIKYLQDDMLVMAHKGVAKYLIYRVEKHQVTGVQVNTLLYDYIDADRLFEWLNEKKETNLFEEILSANKRNQELPLEERSPWKVFIGIVIMR